MRLCAKSDTCSASRTCEEVERSSSMVPAEDEAVEGCLLIPTTEDLDAEKEEAMTIAGCV